MKTVGDKLEKFAVTGVKPGQPSDAFFDITEKSFEGKWKVIVYYPKDFPFVCPTEIVAYDKLAQDFADRDAVLLTGSTDNDCRRGEPNIRFAHYPCHRSVSTGWYPDRRRRAQLPRQGVGRCSRRTAHNYCQKRPARDRAAGCARRRARGADPRI